MLIFSFILILLLNFNLEQIYLANAIVLPIGLAIFMEELIKAKDEQIAKLNDLKELLKKQIISLQEENSKLKTELFEIEEKIKQLPQEATSEPDYLSMFKSINVKLTAIVEKLDAFTMERITASSSLKESIATPHTKAKQQESGLIKPSSLFSDLESSVETINPQLYNEPKQKETTAESQDIQISPADPRSLQRQVLEIDYPNTGVIQCPKCNKIAEFQEMPDPGRGSFAKKYYCKKCRQEWRYRY